MEFPPIPSWDGLHPLLIHFPIGLLLVAPVFVVLGALSRKHGRGLFLAALLLMAFGTVSAWLAVATGEAAGALADRGPGVNPVLLRHEELAERTRFLFTGLTVVFALMLFVPGRLSREPKRSVVLAAGAVFLLAYAGGAVSLANTAHNGGRLVHEFGLRALMPMAPATATVAPDQSAGVVPRERG